METEAGTVEPISEKIVQEEIGDCRYDQLSKVPECVKELLENLKEHSYDPATSKGNTAAVAQQDFQTVGDADNLSSQTATDIFDGTAKELRVVNLETVNSPEGEIFFEEPSKALLSAADFGNSEIFFEEPSKALLSAADFGNSEIFFEEPSKALLSAADFGNSDAVSQGEMPLLNGQENKPEQMKDEAIKDHPESSKDSMTGQIDNTEEELAESKKNYEPPELPLPEISTEKTIQNQEKVHMEYHEENEGPKEQRGEIHDTDVSTMVTVAEETNSQGKEKDTHVYEATEAVDEEHRPREEVMNPGEAIKDRPESSKDSMTGQIDNTEEELAESQKNYEPPELTEKTIQNQEKVHMEYHEENEGPKEQRGEIHDTDVSTMVTVTEETNSQGKEKDTQVHEATEAVDEEHRPREEVMNPGEAIKDHPESSKDSMTGQIDNTEEELAESQKNYEPPELPLPEISTEKTFQNQEKVHMEYHEENEGPKEQRGEIHDTDVSTMVTVAEETNSQGKEKDTQVHEATEAVDEEHRPHEEVMNPEEAQGMKSEVPEVVQDLLVEGLKESGPAFATDNKKAEGDLTDCQHAETRADGEISLGECCKSDANELLIRESSEQQDVGDDSVTKTYEYANETVDGDMGDPGAKNAEGNTTKLEHSPDAVHEEHEAAGGIANPEKEISDKDEIIHNAEESTLGDEIIDGSIDEKKAELMPKHQSMDANDLVTENTTVNDKNEEASDEQACDSVATQELVEEFKQEAGDKQDHLSDSLVTQELVEKSKQASDSLVTQVLVEESKQKGGEKHEDTSDSFSQGQNHGSDSNTNSKPEYLSSGSVSEDQIEKAVEDTEDIKDETLGDVNSMAKATDASASTLRVSSEENAQKTTDPEEGSDDFCEKSAVNEGHDKNKEGDLETTEDNKSVKGTIHETQPLAAKEKEISIDAVQMDSEKLEKESYMEQENESVEVAADKGIGLEETAKEEAQVLLEQNGEKTEPLAAKEKEISIDAVQMDSEKLEKESYMKQENESVEVAADKGISLEETAKEEAQVLLEQNGEKTEPLAAKEKEISIDAVQMDSEKLEKESYMEQENESVEVAADKGISLEETAKEEAQVLLEQNGEKTEPLAAKEKEISIDAVQMDSEKLEKESYMEQENESVEVAADKGISLEEIPKEEAQVLLEQNGEIEIISKSIMGAEESSSTEEYVEQNLFAKQEAKSQERTDVRGTCDQAAAEAKNEDKSCDPVGEQEVLTDMVDINKDAEQKSKGEDDLNNNISECACAPISMNPHNNTKDDKENKEVDIILEKPEFDLPGAYPSAAEEVQIQDKSDKSETTKIHISTDDDMSSKKGQVLGMVGVKDDIESTRMKGEDNLEATIGDVSLSLSSDKKTMCETITDKQEEAPNFVSEEHTQQEICNDDKKELDGHTENTDFEMLEAVTESLPEVQNEETSGQSQCTLIYNLGNDDNLKNMDQVTEVVEPKDAKSTKVKEEDTNVDGDDDSGSPVQDAENTIKVDKMQDEIISKLVPEYRSEEMTIESQTTKTEDTTKDESANNMVELTKKNSAISEEIEPVDKRTEGFDGSQTMQVDAHEDQILAEGSACKEDSDITHPREQTENDNIRDEDSSKEELNLVGALSDTTRSVEVDENMSAMQTNGTQKDGIPDQEVDSDAKSTSKAMAEADSITTETSENNDEQIQKNTRENSTAISGLVETLALEDEKVQKKIEQDSTSMPGLVVQAQHDIEKQQEEDPDAPSFKEQVNEEDLINVDALKEDNKIHNLGRDTMNDQSQETITETANLRSDSNEITLSSSAEKNIDESSPSAQGDGNSHEEIEVIKRMEDALLEEAKTTHEAAPASVMHFEGLEGDEANETSAEISPSEKGEANSHEEIEATKSIENVLLEEAETTHEAASAAVMHFEGLEDVEANDNSAEIACSAQGEGNTHEEIEVTQLEEAKTTHEAAPVAVMHFEGLEADEPNDTSAEISPAQGEENSHEEIEVTKSMDNVLLEEAKPTHEAAPAAVMHFEGLEGNEANDTSAEISPAQGEENSHEEIEVTKSMDNVLLEEAKPTHEAAAVMHFEGLEGNEANETSAEVSSIAQGEGNIHGEIEVTKSKEDALLEEAKTDHEAAPAAVMHFEGLEGGEANETSATLSKENVEGVQIDNNQKQEIPLKEALLDTCVGSPSTHRADPSKEQNAEISEEIEQVSTGVVEDDAYDTMEVDADGEKNHKESPECKEDSTAIHLSEDSGVLELNKEEQGFQKTKEMEETDHENLFRTLEEATAERETGDLELATVPDTAEGSTLQEEDLKEGNKHEKIDNVNAKDEDNPSKVIVDSITRDLIVENTKVEASRDLQKGDEEPDTLGIAEEKSKSMSTRSEQVKNETVQRHAQSGAEDCKQPEEISNTPSMDEEKMMPRGKSEEEIMEHQDNAEAPKDTVEEAVQAAQVKDEIAQKQFHDDKIEAKKNEEPETKWDPVATDANVTEVAIDEIKESDHMQPDLNLEVKGLNEKAEVASLMHEEDTSKDLNVAPLSDKTKYEEVDEKLHEVSTSMSRDFNKEEAPYEMQRELLANKAPGKDTIGEHNSVSLGEDSYKVSQEQVDQKDSPPVEETENNDKLTTKQAMEVSLPAEESERVRDNGERVDQIDATESNDKLATEQAMEVSLPAEESKRAETTEEANHEAESGNLHNDQIHLNDLPVSRFLMNHILLQEVDKLGEVCDLESEIEVNKEETRDEHEDSEVQKQEEISTPLLADQVTAEASIRKVEVPKKPEESSYLMPETQSHDVVQPNESPETDKSTYTPAATVNVEAEAPASESGISFPAVTNDLSEKTEAAPCVLEIGDDAKEHRAPAPVKASPEEKTVESAIEKLNESLNSDVQVLSVMSISTEDTLQKGSEEAKEIGQQVEKIEKAPEVQIHGVSELSERIKLPVSSEEALANPEFGKTEKVSDSSGKEIGQDVEKIEKAPEKQIHGVSKPSESSKLPVSREDALANPDSDQTERIPDSSAIDDHKLEEVLENKLKAADNVEAKQDEITGQQVQDLKNDSTEEDNIATSPEVQLSDVLLHAKNNFVQPVEKNSQEATPAVSIDDQETKEATDAQLEEEEVHEEEDEKETDEHQTEKPGHDAAIIVEARDADLKPVEKVSEEATPAVNIDDQETKEATHGKMEERKIDEEKDEKETDEHKTDEPGHDAAIIVEARDADLKPHKKSHNILSGVGSKVKNSIAKVKKAITGKSSHHKVVLPK